MPELTKQDIKEIFLDSFEPFAKSIHEDHMVVGKRLGSIESKVDGLESKVDGLEDKVDNLDKRMGLVEINLKEVAADVREMKENSSELFGKLDRFITLYEKHEQELKVMAVQISRLDERVMRLEHQRA